MAAKKKHMDGSEIELQLVINFRDASDLGRNQSRDPKTQPSPQMLGAKIATSQAHQACQATTGKAKQANQPTAKQASQPANQPTNQPTNQPSL